MSSLKNSKNNSTNSKNSKDNSNANVKQSRLYDIIILTETWLNNSITNAMLLHNNYYSIYR